MALSFSTCLFRAALDGSLPPAGGEDDGGVISREERRPAEEAA